MVEIFEKSKSWVSLLPPFTLSNLIEVVILAIFFYACLVWIKNTHAWQLLKGILVIIAFTIFAIVLQLTTIVWILERVSAVAIIAAVIIFQPELRKALEQLGSKPIFAVFFPRVSDAGSDFDSIEEIVKATFSMAKKKTGALIVMEEEQSLREISHTGIPVDGVISSALLINIFEKNTPLHDGAVIIANNRVESATCYLPLSEATDISKAYGTRHRAALGVSEVSDAITIVVSEETGKVSIAKEGKLSTIHNAEELRNALPKKKEEGNDGFPRHLPFLWKGKGE